MTTFRPLLFLALGLVGQTVSAAAPALAPCCAVRAFAPEAVQPLPPSAKGVVVDPAKGYAVTDLGDGAYWVTDGFYTTLFLTTGKGVIVIDAPPSLGEKMLKAIGDVTKEPVKIVIYTHSHADHIGGAHWYPKDAQFVAHRETAKRLALQNDPRRVAPYGVFVGGATVPMPTKTFEQKYTVKLGRQTLELIYDGDDHEPGNLYVWAPKQKVLTKIDIVFPGWAPFPNLAIAENVPGYLASFDRILQFDFRHLVSGHWNRLATRQDVEQQRDYFRDISINAAAALKSTEMGPLFQQAAFPQNGNISLLFDSYLKTVAQTCAGTTLSKWKDRLGGADVATYSHCFSVMMSMRVD